MRLTDQTGPENLKESRRHKRIALPLAASRRPPPRTKGGGLGTRRATKGKAQATSHRPAPAQREAAASGPATRRTTSSREPSTGRMFWKDGSLRAVGPAEAVGQVEGVGKGGTWAVGPTRREQPRRSPVIRTAGQGVGCGGAGRRQTAAQRQVPAALQGASGGGARASPGCRPGGLPWSGRGPLLLDRAAGLQRARGMLNPAAPAVLLQPLLLVVVVMGHRRLVGRTAGGGTSWPPLPG